MNLLFPSHFGKQNKDLPVYTISQAIFTGNFKKMSKVYSLKTVQRFPVPAAGIWDFFCNPSNLERITPQGMGFKIIGDQHSGSMYAGQIIEYKVSPVLSIPLYWMTEITQVKEGEYFIDEQRFGPYTLWHHQHHFKAIPGGVEMTDIVHYKLPFWFFGDIAHAIFVKNKLKGIFDFRYQKAEEIFGKM